MLRIGQNFAVPTASTRVVHSSSACSLGSRPASLLCARERTKGASTKTFSRLCASAAFRVSTSAAPPSSSVPTPSTAAASRATRRNVHTFMSSLNLPPRILALSAHSARGSPTFPLRRSFTHLRRHSPLSSHLLRSDLTHQHARTNPTTTDSSQHALFAVDAVDPASVLLLLLLATVLLLSRLRDDSEAAEGDTQQQEQLQQQQPQSLVFRANTTEDDKPKKPAAETFNVTELQFLRTSSKGTKDSFITRYWRKSKKVATHLSRLFVLSMYFMPALLTAPLVRIFPSLEPMWWRLLISAIERSGAAFVKFGQWAASRADLFSEEVVDRLGSLRNRAPEHPLAITQELFRAAFGVDLDAIFLSFDEEPVASGSIAQVYKATLLPKHSPTGQPLDVAVKVRHPWVVSQIHTDLLLLYWIAKQLTQFRAFKWMELPVSVRDFAQHLAQQVDLNLEADNLRRFVANFRDISTVHFPRPIDPLVAEAVIVETWEDGVPMTQYVTSRKHPLNPRLARMGFTAFLKMLLIDNFIHADCHSDNILVRLNNKGKPEIVMLDVGLVTELNQRDKDCIISLMKVLFFKDPTHAAETLVDLSSRQHIDRDVDVPAFRKEMYDTFVQIFSIPDKERELSRTMTAVFSVMRRHHVKMESNLAMLAVSMAVLEGIARRLDPGIDLLPVAAPYLFYNFSFVRALSQLSEGVRFDRRPSTQLKSSVGASV